MKVQNRLYAIFMILISLFFYLYSFKFMDPDASTWPKLFSFILIVLSIGLLITSIKKDNNNDNADNNNEKINYKNNKDILYVALLTILYLITINITGFLITTVIFILLILWILKYKNIIGSLSISFGTTIILSLIFQYVLGVPLPEILF